MFWPVIFESIIVGGNTNDNFNYHGDSIKGDSMKQVEFTSLGKDLRNNGQEVPLYKVVYKSNSYRGVEIDFYAYDSEDIINHFMPNLTGKYLQSKVERLDSGKTFYALATNWEIEITKVIKE